jgi:hypothetical protein
MTIGKIAHDYAWLLPHEFLLLTMRERIVDRVLNMVGMREEHGSFADREVGSGRSAVLSGPRVNRIEEDSMSFKHVRIGKTFGLREAFQCGIDAGHERGMFKTPDDVGIFFLSETTQVTLCLKIAERTERHGLTSRR